AFFPLPIQCLGVFRRPAVGDPVWVLVGGICAGAAGESHDNFHADLFCELHGFAESLVVALGDDLVRMHGISVTTQDRYLIVVVRELLLPCFEFRGIAKQLIERAMLVIGVTACTNL